MTQQNKPNFLKNLFDKSRVLFWQCIAYIKSTQERRAFAISTGLHIFLFIVLVLSALVWTSNDSKVVTVSAVSSGAPIVQAQMISGQAVQNIIEQKQQEKADKIRRVEREKTRLEDAKAAKLKALSLKRAKLREAEKRKQDLAKAKKLALKKKQEAEKERVKKKKAEALAAKQKQQQAKEAKAAKAAKAAKEAAEKLKLLGLAGLDSQLNSHEGDVNAKANAQKTSSEIARYILAIRQRVEAKWNNPFEDAFKATVNIKLSDSGRVLASNIISSSGNRQFDTQLLLAIKKSSPLPLPKDKDARNKMLNINLVFSNG